MTPTPPDAQQLAATAATQASTEAQASTDALTARHKLILIVLLAAGFMGSVDFSVLNVALPLAGDGVGMATRDLPWIQSAIALPIAGFTLLFGRLGDLFGRRRMFLLGSALLAAGSVLGGVAIDSTMLLAGRVIQGFGAAFVGPSAMSLLTTTFPEGRMRARVLGLNGALLSCGFSVGALVGGTLVTAIGWRGAFWINVPVIALILILTPFVVPESRRPDRTRIDLPGAVTVTLGLVGVVYAVIEASVLAAIVGVLLLGAFWLIESRAADPLVPLRILRLPTVKWGNVAGFTTFLIEPAVIFLITLYLEQHLGLSPLAVGLVLGIPGLVSVGVGPVAGRVIGRHGPSRVLAVGLAVQGAALAPLVFLHDGASSLFLLVPFLVLGFLGHVTAIVGFNVTATSGLPNTEQGLATGLTSMTGTVASTIGIPALAALAAALPGLDGLRLTLGIAAVFTVASAALVGRFLADRRRVAAARPRCRRR